MSRSEGPGAERARARLAAHRAAQEERIGAAPPTVTSRQVKRQRERRAAKQPLGMNQKQWHHLRGFPRL